METTYLNEEIERLENESVYTSFSDEDNDKLQEFQFIKQQINTNRFWHFDCWNRNGNMKTIIIEALSEENATIIFKSKYEGLGFDPPY